MIEHNVEVKVTRRIKIMLDEVCFSKGFIDKFSEEQWPVASAEEFIKYIAENINEEPHNRFVFVNGVGNIVMSFYKQWFIDLYGPNDIIGEFDVYYDSIGAEVLNA